MRALALNLLCLFAPSVVSLTISQSRQDQFPGLKGLIDGRFGGKKDKGSWSSSGDVEKDFERPPVMESQGYDFATTDKMDARGCPVMPANKHEWESSYLWGVFIDGKDVKKGPHVYDWDTDFSKHVSKTLSGIYAKEDTPEGQQDLNVNMIEHFRRQTYGDTDYTPPHDLAAKGIMPHCTNKMSCDDVKALLQRMPKDFYSYHQKTEEEKQRAADGCPLGLTAETKSSKPHLLEHLVNSYNRNLAQAKAEFKSDREAMKEKILEHLVAFLRGFAFLHPFQGGNGRLRNMLLQRELRRLGLGCGTMMYNYNKDAFVDGFPRYLAKVKDGIKQFEKAYQTRRNPWHNHETVEKHTSEFEAISGLEKCTSENKQFGSGGNIALDEQVAGPM